MDHPSLTDDAKLNSFLCGKNVLLVDDSEINRELGSDILTDAGMNVDTAEDGAAAVRKVTEAPADRYDLILMDVQMPILNGYDATRAIRALPDPVRAALPIIAMSASVFDEDMRNAAAAGMSASLPKPFTVSELEQVLTELFG